MKSNVDSYKKPKNFLKTLKRLLHYYKGWKLVILIIVILLTIFSSISSIIGTFMLKDVINIILGIRKCII